MLKMIVPVLLFLIFVYIFTYLRTKKTKKKTSSINSVEDFRRSYSHLYESSQTRRKTAQDPEYRNYVTKYNSSEDYREKRG